MKANYFTPITALLALPLAAELAGAQAATLKVGDPAPQLQVAKWVQGEPVKEFKKDTAYIVEFWATWCGPCRVSIPHLNEVHKKFKDKGLVVIGQDVWERDVEAVAPFVKNMGEKMTYRVALDSVEPGADANSGKMAKTWMEAAGQNGIPTAFVIDKQGKVAWIGHPMELEAKVIEQVLAGTFDVAKVALEREALQKQRERISGIWSKAMADIQAKNWDQALAKFDDVEKLLPAEQRIGLAMPRFEVLLNKKDYPAAYKLAGQLSDTLKDNGELQNALAWEIATKEGIADKDRDLKLAEKIANRANEATGGKEPNVLDTLARVLFMNGNKAKAIELEQKAVDLAQDDLKAKLKPVLASYKAGKLPKP